jgi:hypothetical protein
LDLIKLHRAINGAREIIKQICEEPTFPRQITSGFTLIDFTPEPSSVPLRAALMDIVVKPVSKSFQERQQTHFTPVEYKFINKYLRTMPQFPVS